MRSLAALAVISLSVLPSALIAQDPAAATVPGYRLARVEAARNWVLPGQSHPVSVARPVTPPPPPRILRSPDVIPVVHTVPVETAIKPGPMEKADANQKTGLPLPYTSWRPWSEWKPN